jgi:hypothetical protein
MRELRTRLTFRVWELCVSECGARRDTRAITQLHVCSCVVLIQMYENYQNETCESVRELRTRLTFRVWELCVSECGTQETHVLLLNYTFVPA